MAPGEAGGAHEWGWVLAVGWVFVWARGRASWGSRGRWFQGSRQLPPVRGVRPRPGPGPSCAPAWFCFARFSG